MKLTAPYIDELINRSRNGALNQIRELRIYFLHIYDVMKSLKHDGDDDVRLLWIEIPRGTIHGYNNIKCILVSVENDTDFINNTFRLTNHH
jgi:hypothetical protein